MVSCEYHSAGSTFIGAVYVGTLFEARDFSELILRVIILTPLLADAFFTLIRRLLNNQNIFKGHNLHLYQRLNKGGMGHSQITFNYLGSSALICIVGLYNLSIALFGLLVISYGIYLDQTKAVPFKNIIKKFIICKFLY